MGCPPLLSESGLVCLAVAQALLGHHSEARWLKSGSSGPASPKP